MDVQPRARTPAGLRRLYPECATDWRRANWRKALAAVDWSARFLALYADQPLPETLKRILSDQRTAEETAALAELLDSAQTTRTRLDQALTRCDTILPRAALVSGGWPFEAAPLQAIKARVDTLLGDSDSLHDLLVCKRSIRRCHDLGLGDLITKALDEHLPAEALPAIFERRFITPRAARPGAAPPRECCGTRATQRLILVTSVRSVDFRSNLTSVGAQTAARLHRVCRARAGKSCAAARSCSEWGGRLGCAV